LCRSLPSPFSAGDLLSLFEEFIGTMPRCDSSPTYIRAVRPKPSPAGPTGSGHRRGLPVLVQEVSRRALGSQTTQDRSGSRASDPLAFCLPRLRERRRPDCTFSKLNTQPTYSPVYASPRSSRRAAQNSGPSGSLLLPRKEFTSSASCRFIPALSLASFPRN